MSESRLWQQVARALADGRSCALLVVADSRGSSPGRRGAVMAVDGNGPLAGTIGGGRAEAALVDEACTALRAGTLSPGSRRQQHRLAAEEPSGLVCGGEHCVVLAPLSPADLDAVKALENRLATGVGAGWQVTAAGWRPCPTVPPQCSWQLGDDWCYTQAAGPSCRAFLVGGGHVSLALTPLLVSLDFHVTVIESRQGIDSFLGNASAHARIHRDYAGLRDIVMPGFVVVPTAKSFVGIMTHDCGLDRVALDALDGVPLAYLGLLGSRAKIRRLTEGRTMPPFFRAPMGLPIDSHTPAEIAVSIAAEWVQERARQASGGPC